MQVAKPLSQRRHELRQWRSTSPGAISSRAYDRMAVRICAMRVAAGTPCPTTSPITKARPAGRQPDHVVPVAADLDPGGRGQVPRRDPQALDVRHHRDHALRQLRRQVPLAVEEARVVERDGGVAGDALRERRRGGP